ncbi:fasciclin domain-containing protein [Chelatococcus reniformis]|nr:fasciclin domain-containing protein [Chelatococcus reniformis]
MSRTAIRLGTALLATVSVISLAPSAFSEAAKTTGKTAEKTVMVGGAPMYPSKTIIENAVNSKDHTTLVAAVKAAGLVNTLSGRGPFTVFAPTNAAFAKLPPGTVDSLVRPENKATLTAVLTYHVVPGRLTAKDLAAAIDKGEGKAVLKTAQGETLSATMKDKWIVVTDAKGGTSTVAIADVMQSNGVIHVVDRVLMP